MPQEGTHNDTGPWPPHGTWIPHQRTDTENAEYNSSRAPNSTTHSVDSYNSNSERSPDEHRSESFIRNTGALFEQEIVRRSTTLSSDSTTGHEHHQDNNMSTVMDSVPGPVQPLVRSDGAPQLGLHTNVLYGRGHGVKRRGSDIDDTSNIRAGQSPRSGAAHLRSVERSNSDKTEYKGVNAPRYGAEWIVTESPTHVSEQERDDDDQVSISTAGPDDSDEEGKRKGGRSRNSSTPNR